MKHLFQPDGISCGPTCLKMSFDHVSGKNDITIRKLMEVCETDGIIGTPPERMLKGLVFLGLNFNEKNGMDNLIKTLNEGNIGILRTFLGSIPHWIISYKYNSDRLNCFAINDPARGQVSYSKEELNSIWIKRDYFYYEILSK